MRPLIGINCEVETPPGKGPKAILDQRYVEAIEKAGGVPVLISPLQDPRGIAELLEGLDGLVLSGGDDIDPKLYGEQQVHATVTLLPKDKEQFDFELAKQAVAKQIPTLGICYGMQLLSVVLGGTLHQHLFDGVPKASEHRKVDHPVQIQSGSRLREIVGQEEIQIHSSHHQAVKNPGPEFAVVAQSQDGVIEGIEGKCRAFLIGVQWHPERNPQTPSLFRALVQAAGSNPKRA